MTAMRYVIAAIIALFIALPADAGEVELAVGECRQAAAREVLCRGGADWYVIVELGYSVTMAVASD